MKNELDEDLLIEALGRSELLGIFRPLLNDTGIRSIVGDLLQFHVIIDTNIIVSDLNFLVRLRRQKDVQPTVKELLKSKTIVGYFPEEALSEVEAKCEKMAGKYGISLEVWLAEWKEYRALLHAVPSEHIGCDLPAVQRLRDPTDAPFLQAREVVGAQAIVTNDLDIGAASVPVIPKARVLMDLRDYSRNRAVRVAAVLGTGTAVMIPLAAVVGLIKIARLVVQKAPRSLLVGLGIILFVALLHPKSREFLIKAAKSVLSTSGDCAGVIGPALARSLEAANKADGRAAELRVAVEKQLKRITRSRPTLGQAVYRACRLAPEPLGVPEILVAVTASGIKLRAKEPVRSVAIALKRHPLLAQCPDGRWKLREATGQRTSGERR